MPQCVAIWRRGGATKKFNLVEAKSDTMKIFGANAFHGYTAINADTLALDNPNAIQNSPAGDDLRRQHHLLQCPGRHCVIPKAECFCTLL
jgi:hypothetical protein